MRIGQWPTDVVAGLIPPPSQRRLFTVVSSSGSVSFSDIVRAALQQNVELPAKASVCASIRRRSTLVSLAGQRGQRLSS